jgi:hypothetical protein
MCSDLLIMAHPQAGYDGTEGMEPGAGDASGEAAVESEAADLIEEKVSWSYTPWRCHGPPVSQGGVSSAGFQLAL